MIQKNPEIFAELGRASGISGNYSEAYRLFDKAIFMNSNNPTPYFYRGILKLSQGKYNQAKADFSKSCKLGNDDACEYVDDPEED